jgi:hypothetical protein
MPQRQGQKRIETPELQGDDSYVVFRRMSIQEVQDILKANKQEIAEEMGRLSEEGEAGDKKPLSPAEIAMAKLDQSLLNIEVTNDTLAKVLHSWNWVDDFGEPLPQPASNPDVMNRLNDEEYRFLSLELGKILAPTSSVKEKKD